MEKAEVRKAAVHECEYVCQVLQKHKPSVWPVLHLVTGGVVYCPLHKTRHAWVVPDSTVEEDADDAR